MGITDEKMLFSFFASRNDDNIIDYQKINVLV